MPLPSNPVDRIRPGRFRPPHCPWRDCPRHVSDGRFRWKRVGSYRRAADPRRRVPRYRCKTCRRGFSRQSFSCTYYLKRPELLAPIAAGLVAGCAHRQIARSLGCAPSTVTRLAARLGRHALLLQAIALQQLTDLNEPAVLDHFETFVFSQEDGLGIATPVGQGSGFVYAIDPAPHRGGGRRSRRRAPRARPLPGYVPNSYRESARRVLDLLVKLARDRVDLVSDDHGAYRAARKQHPARAHIRHRVYPNPPRGPGADPAPARARDRAMFQCDDLHRLWRHSQAHHRRETIAFGRRANAVLERAAVMMIWRNFVKARTERRKSPTPAMKIGLTTKPMDWSQLLGRRLFPGRIATPEGWMRIYRREWITPAVGRNLRHDLARAY